MIKLKVKKMAKNNKNIPTFSTIKLKVKSRIENVLPKFKKKAQINNSTKTIKLIGFDLPKKLANIISFVIFAV